MKDYNKVVEKIRKMGKFCDMYQCGPPTEVCPVNLCFQLCEAYMLIGYRFYVSYRFGKWSIDYTLDSTVKRRTDMKHIGGIKTDRDMYKKVEEIIYKMREQN